MTTISHKTNLIGTMLIGVVIEVLDDYVDGAAYIALAAESLGFVTHRD